MKIISGLPKGAFLHLTFLILISLKLSYFNLPSIYPKSYDWYGWSLKNTVFSYVSSFALLLIITSPLIVLSRKMHYVFLLFVNFLVTTVIVADLIHFRFFGDFISIVSLGYAWQVSLISSSIFELFEWTDFLFLLDLILTLIFLPAYFKKTAPEENGNKKKRSTFFYFFLTGFLLMILPAREIITDKEGIFTFEFQRFFGVKKIGLLNFHIYQAGKIFYNANLLGNKISPEDKRWVSDFIKEKQTGNSLPSPSFGIAEKKNLIVIMVESLMAFPVGIKIENQEITPNLSSFFSKSIYFKNFFDQTWEGKTSDGEFTSLHSLHPLYTGSVSTTYPANNYRALPKILNENGYATVAATAYNGELWNNRFMNKKLGFQKSYFDVDYKLTELLGLGLSDNEFFIQTSEKLSQLKKPFMAFLITLSTHHPYSAFKGDTLLNLGDFDGTILGNYIRAVHYFDFAFGEFIKLLKRSGLYDESVIVLYGDHHSDVGEPGDLKNLLLKYDPNFKNQIWKDYDYWVSYNKIPFCIHLPNDALSGIKDLTCGHLDIANTLLDILGIKNAHMVSFGKNLMLQKNSFVVFSNGSFVYKDTLFITADGAMNDAKAFNLSNGTRMDPKIFQRDLNLTWEELDLSNLIISGDFIPDK
ncbi:MAG: LTA synthase family protein [Ignavibacteria bacterium]